jgi:DNA-binding NarL/FixJ family response regulator
MSNKIQVIIVDDHKLVTDCIGLFLKGANPIEVIGICHSGKDTLAMLKKVKPDVILFDISMPEMSGIQVTEAVKKSIPKSRFLFFQCIQITIIYLMLLMRVLMDMCQRMFHQKNWLKQLQLFLQGKTTFIQQYLMK